MVIVNINCCKEAKSRGYSERVQLACLLHDASESYISDITRPVKCNLPEYDVMENKLLESHPELYFAMLDSGEPVYVNKKTYEGTRKRIEFLRQYYDKTESIIDFVNKDQKLSKCMDDVIDALCLAVTGMIGIKEESLKRIPQNPMMDAKGILMQMVYA